jgi:hypothetical protein
MKMKNKMMFPIVLIFLISQINAGYSYVLIDDWNETITVNEEGWEENLGSFSANLLLKITVTSNVSIDVLLLDWINYNRYYVNQPFTYISQASQINTLSMNKEYTTTPQETYYFVIDNTNKTTNGANYTGPALVTINVDSSSTSPQGGISGFPLLLLSFSIAVIFILIYKTKKRNIINYH